MKTKIIFLFCFVALLFSACSNKYSIIQLVPEVDIYEAGNLEQVVKMEYEGVDFEIDFLQATKYDLLFELNISNNSKEEIQIVPQDFSYLAIDQRGNVFAKEYAYDPENLLFEIDETIANDVAVAKTENTLSWIFFGIEVLATVVSIADNDVNAPFYAADAGINLVASQAGTATLKRHIVYLESERDYYENAAIRGMTLAPGTQMHGIVIFPRFDEARKLQFQYELNNILFEITYWQNWIKL